VIQFQGDGVLHVRPFLAVTLGIVVLFAGKSLNERFRFLREYNIPEPVTGGVLFALAFWLLHAIGGVQVDFELTARNILLIYFFTTIGMNARVSDLESGGRPLLLLLSVTAAANVLQKVVGTSVAALLGYPAVGGLMAGSLALSGGHGTAIAWAPTLQSEYGLARAFEVSTLCATAGLLLGSLAGGPIARFLIKRHQLGGSLSERPDVGVRYENGTPQIDYFSFLHAILGIHISGILGILGNQALAAGGLKMPLFVTCLLAGILLTTLLPRVAPRWSWPTRTTSLALIAEVSLGVFLAMSLMSMKFWTLDDLAVPLILVLLTQLCAITVLTVFGCFRALGRNYDAAVISAGFVGFALGATPTAMANMTAVTQRHGASHVAFLVVPLVGAFFIDIMNALVIRFFLAIL
jgi:ESS family glutamate:Na+ symporter